MFFRMYTVDVVALALLLGSAASQSQQPNFIVMQPDDMEFFEAWMPPAHVDNNNVFAFPASGLPNMERLRQGSVQMTQAYTATSTCGPSRFSTMTGRYASRSGFSREQSVTEDVVDVTIAKTKVHDGSDDCTQGNMATLLQKNGYRTGVVGKWHLFEVERNAVFSYPAFQERVRQCGFDSVEAINVGGAWRDNTYSHNLEYLADKAIEFIEASEDPFFLYVNPTAPHELASVLEALTEFECTDTPAGKLDSEPQVPGMTAGTTCAAYRQTIIDRANGAVDNNSLGSIWIDDVVGSILQTLEARNILDNTFFIFHLDHGQEGKGSLFEQGLRIPKFVHFPQAFGTGKMFDGLVSTIDTAPTILDYAGVTKDSPGYYEMDGRSWRNAVETSTSDGDRCIYFELDQDRAMRCGCLKYMYIHDASMSTTMRRAGRFGMASTDQDGGELLFDLCDANGVYESTANKEATDIASSNASELASLSQQSTCLLAETFPTTLPNYVDCGLNSAPGVPATEMPVDAPPVVAPTNAPVVAPTEAPVADPTGAPVVAPTDAPVVAPTEAPVVAPTDSPVVASTEAPVIDPTGAPVVAPTDAPVIAPTGAPVVAPTEAPVVAPTDSPVVAPTEAPVIDPTGAPVADPTDAPVVAPTDAPVVAPTEAPVADPTDAPGTTPRPTTKPTPRTRRPTAKSTLRPAVIPTVKPTRRATSKPTATPTPRTRRPTAKPTVKPTVKPTRRATSKPTAKPTPRTRRPTAKPTPPHPTAKPTRRATSKPTAKPTSRTRRPTEAPVMEPAEFDGDAGHISKEVFGRYVDTTVPKLKRCNKHDGPPEQGSGCRTTKTCMFGDQMCLDGLSHPTVVCKCIDATWGCSVHMCP